MVIMLKVALIVLTVSISNPEQPPDISLPIFYNSITECQNQLDELKKDINAIEIFDKNNNRLLKFYNRGYRQEAVIYWYCKAKDIK